MITYWGSHNVCFAMPESHHSGKTVHHLHDHATIHNVILPAVRWLHGMNQAWSGVGDAIGWRLTFVWVNCWDGPTTVASNLYARRKKKRQKKQNNKPCWYWIISQTRQKQQGDELQCCYGIIVLAYVRSCFFQNCQYVYSSVQTSPCQMQRSAMYVFHRHSLSLGHRYARVCQCTLQ